MYVRTGTPAFDELIPRIIRFLEQDLLEVNIDGEKIRGYRSPDARSIWIRNYSDMMRALRYSEADLKSTIRHFADNQARNGRIFDYFTTFPEKLPCERENWTKYVRTPVEADTEFRFIKAAWLAWQATGDDAFIKELIPSFEKALGYVMSGRYFDKDKYLFRRPYTIDTWDFAYTAGQHDWLQFQIDDKTFWGYFHGDNSGYYEAFHFMSYWYDMFGDKIRSAKWRDRAMKLRKSMNSICFNGSFYTHFVKQTPVTIDGVDEASQLSLSNPAAINRGAATPHIAASIINEYMKRRETTSAFAEWFSIDPPFPSGIFGDYKLSGGAYCNGGIMPLTGGELARAALEYGYEQYGIDILMRYYDLISRNGETYLWYFPDGKPSTVERSTSPEAKPTDGWGSSAMLYAFVEGLVGIQDKDKLFKRIRICPRWSAAGIEKAEVNVDYKSSGAYVKYIYSQTAEKMTIKLSGSYEYIQLSLPVPVNYIAGDLLIGGKKKKYLLSGINKSTYVTTDADISGECEIILKLKRKTLVRKVN
ncbi:MAG TPA: hypothetical protein VN276_02835 [Bacteroidales bacterium]|nr:hypothetical protein [Bacteroidales bacterium]